MDNTVFGFNEAQITEFGLTYGVGGLMLLMLFIVGHLAWKCKAGKTGTFVLFLALTFGLIGFIAKFAIQRYLNIH